eukprot:TRINITY_DN10673_c0_g1_i3.p3 TRINITY_DN10673_c0_g1~~TRINITY_DN10673_c0_g1_i3.p3  ORF type:complete len:113 (-),score=23.38 TRINITY_DN10673_c0_g1_i3:372-710(-)
MHASDSKGVAEVYVSTSKLQTPSQPTTKRGKGRGFLRRNPSSSDSLSSYNSYSFRSSSRSIDATPTPIHTPTPTPTTTQPKYNFRNIMFNCNLHLMHLPVEELVLQLVSSLE